MTRIMVVDDDPEVRRLLGKILKKEGFEVVPCESGMEAIERVAEIAPDLILLDVNMPEIDGLETCRRLVGDNAKIPIIFLTAQAAVDDRVAGLEAGGRDYVTKPFHAAELHARVRAVLKEKLAQDAAEKRAEEFKILAISDALSGVANRRYFDVRYAEERDRAERYKTPLSCLMVDIDRFKAVNDTFGHAVGDQVIQEVARILKKAVRSCDFIARYGGEEFVALLPETDLKEARIIAERIRAGVEELKPPAGIEQVTVSIGVSIGLDERLVERADQALYEAKRNGRNRVEVWREGGRDGA
jgi:diguanylate cyclase (GGDEF)-like protein